MTSVNYRFTPPQLRPVLWTGPQSQVSLENLVANERFGRKFIDLVATILFARLRPPLRGSPRPQEAYPSFLIESAPV